MVEWDPNKRGNSWFWPLMREGESGSQFWERLQPYDDKGYDIWTKVTSGKHGRVVCMRYADKKVMAGVYTPLYKQRKLKK
jgi:hypothetical protein